MQVGASPSRKEQQQNRDAYDLVQTLLIEQRRMEVEVNRLRTSVEAKLEQLWFNSKHTHDVLVDLRNSARPARPNTMPDTMPDIGKELSSISALSSINENRESITGPSVDDGRPPVLASTFDLECKSPSLLPFRKRSPERDGGHAPDNLVAKWRSDATVAKLRSDATGDLGVTARVSGAGIRHQGTRSRSSAGILPSNKSNRSNQSFLSTSRSIKSRAESELSHKPRPTRRARGILSADWPETLNPRYELQQMQADEDGGIATQSLPMGTKPSMRSANLEEGLRMTPQHFENCWNVCFCRQALRPDSRALVAKEAVGFLVLLYDILVLPFLLSWDIEVKGILLNVAGINAAYWTLDCLLGFVTGYNDGGLLIISQPQSARRYLCTGFLMDVVLAAIDWTSVYFHGIESETERLRIIGLLQMLRIFYVLRLKSLPKALEKVIVFSLPYRRLLRARILINVAKVSSFVLLLNHVMCCFWHMLGKSEGDTGLTWMDLPFDLSTGETYRSLNPTSLYLTAFHWNLAQVTLGSNEVFPRNSWERVFNVIQLLIGLIIGTTVVSIFSAQIVQFVIAKHEEASLLETLRRFLADHNIARNLRERIIQQVEERMQERSHLIEDDVAALQYLPSSLRSELMLEMRMPHIRTHQLFQMWAEADMTAIRQLSDTAVRLFFLCSNDDLFIASTPGSEAYFMIRGSLLYLQSPVHAMVDSEESRQLCDSLWFCEAALWADWTHVGDMTSLGVSHIMELSSGGLFTVLRQHEAVRGMTAFYARSFHVRIVSAVPPHAPFPDDVSIPFTAATDLLSQKVGLGLLKRSTRMGRVSLSPEQRKRLEKELRGELCALQAIPGSQGLERIVAVAAVKLESFEGRSFYQIAKFSKEKGYTASCQLPGTKRARGELPQAALQRVMASELKTFQGKVHWLRTEHEVETTTSEQYNLQTTYTRTVHVAQCEVAEGLTALPVCWSAQEQECHDSSQPFPLKEVCKREVFVGMRADTEDAVLYSWLYTIEVEALKSPSEELSKALAEWLGTIDIKSLSLPPCLGRV